FCFRVDGLREFRYVLVFALMAVVLCLPAALQALRASPRLLRSAVACACLLPPLGLGVALAHPAPSAQLQESLGVQSAVGRTRDGEDAIRKLVHEASLQPYIPRLYSLHPFLVADGPFGSAPLVSDEGGKIPFVVFRANHPFRPYVLNLQDIMT